ncbi:MAG: nucleotide sugar dehydrogenase [Vicinamibacterales bacterium]
MTAGAARPVIGYAGLTHLGVVSGLAAAAKGFETVGFDPDAVLVTDVAAGRFRFVEPGLDALFATAAPRFTASADPGALRHCDVVFIAVDVPTDARGRSDVAPVRALVSTVAAAVKPGASIVVLSQVIPGFTRAEREQAEASGARLYYQVETLIFGRAVERAMEPERFMVGLADPAEPLPPALRQFLESFGCPVLPMRYESAELCKISINMFLVSSVSTTNMLAEVCESIGADWREIAPALRLDRRIGPHAYLTPGLGIGGGNLTRDLASVQALAGANGTDAGLVETWLVHSEYRRDWALRTLYAHGLGTPGTVLGIWGLAYKEHTQFTKNSPALALIAALPGFEIRAYDPAVAEAETPRGVTRTGTALDAVRGVDLLAIMTPWPEFGQVDPVTLASAMRGRVVVDPFGVLTPDAARGAGLEHRRLGTGTLPSA